MKLGDIRHRRAVQSLGRYNIGLPAAQARATSELINAATGVMQDIEVIEAEAEYAQGMADLENQVNTLQTDMASKSSYSRDYLQQLEIDIPTTPEEEETLTFRQEIPAYEVQNQVFSAEMAKISKGVKGSLKMPTARLRFDRTVPGLEARMRGAVMQDTLKRQQDASIAKFSVALSQAIEQGTAGAARAESTIDRMEALRLISREKAAEMREELPAQLEIADLTTLLTQSTSIRDLDAEAKYLRSRDYDGALSPEQRRIMASKFEQRSNRLEAQYSEDWTKANSDRIANTFNAAYEGNLTSPEVDYLRKEGLLGHDKVSNNETWLRLQNIIRSVQASAGKKQADLMGFFELEGPVAYGDPDNRKKTEAGYDYYYEALKQASPQTPDPDIRIEASLRAFDKSGIVPQAFKNDVQVAMNTGNLGALGRVATAYQRMQTLLPGAELNNQFSFKEFAEFDAFANNMNSGVGAEEAFTQVTRRRTMSDAARQMEDQRWADAEREIDWVDEVRSAMDPGWFSLEPSRVMPHIVSDARRFAELAYKSTGDLDRSIELGIEKATSTAGIETFGESHASAYPLLKAFPVFQRKGGEKFLLQEIGDYKRQLGYDGPIWFLPSMNRNHWRNGAPTYAALIVEDDVEKIVGEGWQPRVDVFTRMSEFEEEREKAQIRRRNARRQEDRLMLKQTEDIMP